MKARAERIRTQGDPEFKKMKSTMGGLPGWASRFVLNFAGFLLYTLNLWTPLLGSPRDPFGSCMVTSIGGLGLDLAFAPLVPYSRVPLLIAVGAVRDTPVVRDGKLAIAPVSRLCVTIDHRLIDGMQASHMAKTLAAYIRAPRARARTGLSSAAINRMLNCERSSYWHPSGDTARRCASSAPADAHRARAKADARGRRA